MIPTIKSWYHGDTSSRATFLDQVWDRDTRHGTLNRYGPGIYSTSYILEAAQYGPYIYEVFPNRDFEMMTPEMKITLRAMMEFYMLAPDYRKEIFLDDWEMTDPVEALEKYVSSYNSLHGGYLNLSQDLLANNPDMFVEIMREIGWDGAIVDTIYHECPVQYLLVWSPEKCNFVETYFNEEEANDRT